MNNFKVNLNCIVFSTNITLNQRLVLSLDKEKIIFPSLYLNSDNLNHLDDTLIQFLKQYVFVSDLELLPQLISLDNSILNNDPNNATLNVVYGFIVNHTNSLNNAFWVEFQLLKEQPYSNLLFEVIQKLR
ncbi:MAG: hypothetical protein ACKO7N_01650 [Candidatus Nitrosotenuis sp.]